MGNYIFNRDVLVHALLEAQGKGRHDFGAHIIPGLVEKGKVYAYDFGTNKIPGVLPYEEQGYWRDVGSIPAFYQAHMDMLGEHPIFDLHNKKWPIHPPAYKGPAARIFSGEIRNSIISEGVTVRNARIVNSVIRRDVVIEDGASVEDSIIMDHTVVGKGCRLRRVIVDKFNDLSQGIVAGFGENCDRLPAGCLVDGSGVVVIPKAERKIR